MHPQDPRLGAVLDSIPALYEQVGVAQVVVNGTCVEDWPKVLELACRWDFVVPFFGLHPWKVNAASEDWRTGLLRFLDKAAELGRPYGLGECGLDKWIQGHDLSAQKAALHWQINVAMERALPLSLHCLQAWGTLLDVLQSSKPRRPFLLHSYGGPAEMVETFAELGAYFSFSGYFARPEKAAKLNPFRKVPTERLLIETDAPDMPLPADAVVYPLIDGFNHPANLPQVYQLAAGLLGFELDEFTSIVAENFERYINGSHL